MLIDKRTKTKDLLPLLGDKERMERLLEQVEEYPLPKPLISLTCGQFIDATDPEYILGYLKQRRALKALGMIKSYKRQLDEITKLMGINKVKESEEMKRAKINVVFPTFAEDILLTVTEYLHLDRVEKAADVPFSEFLMIQRRTSAEAKVSDNYRKIMEQKSKQRGKRNH